MTITQITYHLRLQIRSHAHRPIQRLSHPQRQRNGQTSHTRKLMTDASEASRHQFAGMAGFAISLQAPANSNRTANQQLAEKFKKYAC